MKLLIVIFKILVKNILFLICFLHQTVRSDDKVTLIKETERIVPQITLGLPEIPALLPLVSPSSVPVEMARKMMSQHRQEEDQHNFQKAVKSLDSNCTESCNDFAITQTIASGSDEVYLPLYEKIKNKK